jgi:hypothetical protein
MAEYYIGYKKKEENEEKNGTKKRTVLATLNSERN